MIFLAFLKRYWLEALVVLGIAATGYYVYGEIKEWQAFTKKAGEDAALVVSLQGQLDEARKRNTDLAATISDMEKKAKADLELIAKRDGELAAAQAALNTQKRKYREAMQLLEGADLECALRTVPAPTDWLLRPWSGEARGGSASGSRDAAGGFAGEAATPLLPTRPPVGRVAAAHR
jgi:hypothetical protein